MRKKEKQKGQSRARAIISYEGKFLKKITRGFGLHS